ncbi:uncharacterized protein (DUF1697 family) [Motilibacter rhizosphaerae]|uniref:Uncharacterized protein (DUF1697 family) n=1 Tax=Motilibacter rhizosphaerae TaxID=598652 RepID=A0A4Q7NT88_9ACTN|nr:DUF1697 domain-containing protein [Motilibacter rhizosphaerae]RZS90327.1 uncharacterized protein (DUF1697 family) [Motilibacter rhizosphaerae]
MSGRWVALLRGINVGRAKQVDMAVLRQVFAGLGCADVRTHLRSGNVVFTADGPPAEDAVEAAVEAATGVSCRVLVRSADELREVADANPYAAVADDPSRLLVAFQSAPMPDDEWAAFQAGVRAPAEAQRVGRAVYVWCPDGVQEATAGLQRTSKGVISTARNWRTVTKLLEIASG